MTVSLTINGTSYDYPETGDLKWGADATDWAQAVTSGMLQKAGGTFQLLADVNFGTTYGLLSQYYKTRTANIASTGQFRLARADQIVWRNEANDGDLVLEVNSSDQLLFNGESPGYIDSVSDTSTINLTVSSGALSADIVAGSITNSMINASAAIAFSKLAALTSGNILVGSAGNVATSVTMSGDATIDNTGALTIANSAVSNAKLANMNNITFKGNISGGAAAPSDLTASQVTANLSVMVGDSGAGGSKGLVPAPIAGDATKFLQGDGTWATPAGAGDVVGPASSTDSGFAKFDGITGKLLKNSAATLVNADIDASAAIAYSKLNLSDSILNADINASAAIALSKLAALTASRVLVSDGSGVVSASSVTSTTLGYLDATSSIQTQLDAKQARSTLTTKGDLYVATASATTTRLAAGTNGYFLQANSGATEGLQYVVPQNSSYGLVNIGLSASVAANAMTIALKTSAGSDASSTDPIFISFGSATITDGTFSVVSVTGALSITIPSGATLGSRNGETSYIYVYALNNAGTVELAVTQRYFDPNIVRSTTAIDTSSDFASIIYSTTARSNVRYRLIGIIESTQTTAGTYAASPTQVGLVPIELKAPSFVATTSSQAVTNGNTLIYTTVDFDPWNMYDSSTGVCTIREKGIYVAYAAAKTASIASGAADNFFRVDLTQAGSYSQNLQGVQDTADASVTRTFASGCFAIFRADVSDTITATMAESIGAGNLDGNTARNNFQVCKIGNF